MEKTMFANSLIIGCSVTEQPFFLSDIRQEENFRLQGKSFSGYILTLQDKSGTIEGFLPSDRVREEYSHFLNSVVRVNGFVLKNEALFIKIDAMAQCLPGEYESKYFTLGLDAGKRKTFVSLIKREIAEVKGVGYRSLLDAVFTDETLEKMGEYPESLKNFANYHGGLLVATATLWHMVRNIAKSYSTCNNGIYTDGEINTDLLYSAALLHGVGRLVEYTEFPYKKSTQGKLQGTVICLQTFLGNVVKDNPGVTITDEEQMALMSTIIPAIDPHSQVKAVSKEAIMLQQALYLYKLCDERDKVVFDYTGEDDIFFAWQLNAYVRNTKREVS